jgi:Caspase domain
VDGTRSALIVAADDYTDPGLRRLRAPAADAQALAGVLREPGIGGFQVRTLLNQPAHEVNLAVEEFFADRRPDDLLLLHVSCHGVKDEDGELYFAAANTQLRLLGATGVAAEFVNRRMNRSRSRRVVLLLDCCYAGAFERGLTARAGAEVGIEERFGGRGRAVITASSAMEYAFEGDELADARELAPSVFTSALVEGLRTGDADRDQDGLVALDELYDYVYDKVREATPNQTPGKWTFGVQGELVIARRARPVTTPVPLPPELQEAIDSPFAGVRAGVVPELARLLRSRHAGMALAARLTLQRLVDDDSRAVSAAASAALAATAQPAPAEPARVDPEQLRAARTAATTHPQVEPELPEGARAGAQQDVALSKAASAPADTAPAAAPAPSPTTSTSSAAAASAPEPTVAATSVDHHPAPQARNDRLLLAAGGLAIVCAILIFLGLFPVYADGYRLASDYDGVWKAADNIWYAVIVGALTLSTGICVFAPRTRRLVGPGLLLGTVAASTWVLLLTVVAAVDNDLSIGPGFRLWLAAHLLLVLAACLAGLASAQAGSAGLVPRPPQGLFPRLVILLGVVSAIGLVSTFVNQQSDSAHEVALIWAIAMALVVPACAAVAVRRQFGVALLGGWIGGGAALLPSFSTDYSNTGGIVTFNLTVLALLVVIIPFARSSPSPQVGRNHPAK